MEHRHLISSNWKRGLILCIFWLGRSFSQEQKFSEEKRAEYPAKYGRKSSVSFSRLESPSYLPGKEK